MNDKADKPLKILLAAVEPSGDALGAALYKELKKKTAPGTHFLGCGGLQMKEEGFESAFPIDAFSIIGLTGFLKGIPEGIKRAGEIGRMAADSQVDIAIFIDGWAFSWRSARYTKMYSPDTITVKYAAPQVWASRPGRVKTVKKHFDSVLTLLPFEPPYFHEAGMSAEFVGNPNFQSVYQEHIDTEHFRARHDLKDSQVLALLPGSRRGEIAQLATIFGETIEQVCKTLPQVRVVIPPAPTVESMVREALSPWHEYITFVDGSERFNLFHAADAALAASGTVTTELAIAQTPMVIAYKVDPLTFFWARSVVTTEYVSILNNAARKEVIPELLQDDCTPDLLVPAVVDLLTSKKSQDVQRQAFERLLADLAINEEPAAARAADSILNLVKKGR